MVQNDFLIEVFSADKVDSHFVNSVALKSFIDAYVFSKEKYTLNIYALNESAGTSEFMYCISNICYQLNEKDS